MRFTLCLSVFFLLSHAAEAAITRPQYDSIIVETQNRLGPWVLESFGKELLVTGDWPKDYSPTSAGGSFYHKDGKWGIHIVGWVARSPEIYRDGMRLIYCHELGHHVEGGGAEVESDYFATSSCAPVVFHPEDPLDELSSLTDADKEDCRSAQDPQYCERVMNAVNQTNEFRAGLWRLQGIFTESEIAETVACRRKVSLHGVLGLPIIPCKH
ncbi:hypothetical protein [Oligoflexus tunisiensis]|uniref:hypothetical protein n=1 Tax=Oligoflexus tunisiensis TaxID=708132 RepID=UPI00114D320A|nr:hypothetical protein [Oligoflexus tunisiensis]